MQQWKYKWKKKKNESIVSAAGFSLSSDPDLSSQIIVNESRQHPVHNTVNDHLLVWSAL